MFGKWPYAWLAGQIFAGDPFSEDLLYEYRLTTCSTELKINAEHVSFEFVEFTFRTRSTLIVNLVSYFLKLSRSKFFKFDSYWAQKCHIL